LKGNELQALLIDDIIFEHWHVYHRKNIDKQIVLQRYNNEMLANAFKIIEETHNIHFNHYWKWWVDKQVYQMTKANFLIRIINTIRRYIKVLK